VVKHDLLLMIVLLNTCLFASIAIIKPTNVFGQTSSSTAVSCGPNPGLILPFSPIQCTAIVSGSDPTGTITWTTNSSTGSFGQTVCTLSNGTCTTSYSDTSPGPATITASYSGDLNNDPSNGSTILFLHLYWRVNTTVNTTSGYAPLSVNFTSEPLGGEPPFSYLWDFGDGSFSTLQNPTHIYLRDGNYTTVLTVTDSEPDDSSWTLTGTINVSASVGITNLSSYKTVVSQGYDINVSATLADSGNYTETFNVTICANTTCFASENVTLSSGDFPTVNFAWNTTGFAYGNYTLSGYAVPVTNETNIVNNNCIGGSVVVTIIGDVNGDFKVDMKDIALIARAFGSTPGDANWNPNADINGDGTVNMKDMALCARNFGQHYP